MSSVASSREETESEAESETEEEVDTSVERGASMEHAHTSTTIDENGPTRDTVPATEPQAVGPSLWKGLDEFEESTSPSKPTPVVFGGGRGAAAILGSVFGGQGVTTITPTTVHPDAPQPPQQHGSLVSDTGELMVAFVRPSEVVSSSPRCSLAMGSPAWDGSVETGVEQPLTLRVQIPNKNGGKVELILPLQSLLSSLWSQCHLGAAKGLEPDGCRVHDIKAVVTSELRMHPRWESVSAFADITQVSDVVFWSLHALGVIAPRSSTWQSVLEIDLSDKVVVKWQEPDCVFHKVFLAATTTNQALVIAEAMTRRLVSCAFETLRCNSDIRQRPTYTTFQQSTGDLQTVDLRAMSFNDAQTFFINVFNCLCLHAHITVGLPDGTDFRRGHDVFMKDAQYRIGEVNYSLEDIFACLRGKAVKKYSPAGRIKSGVPDPRVHFALCDFTRSAPRFKLFTTEALMMELDQATRHYIADHVSVTTSESQVSLILPRTFKKFESDFGSRKEMLQFLARHLEEPEAAYLKNAMESKTKLSIKFGTTDWRLSITDHIEEFMHGYGIAIDN